MRKLLPALITASLLSATASADTFGFYVGAGNWKPDFSGDFKNGTSQINLGSGADNLDIKEKDQTGFYFAFEHPIPVVPNVMLKEQDMSSSGSGTFSASVNFGGEDFEINDTVNTQFDLSHRDYVLYYEILDNWVNLDLGITARQFDGFVTLTDANDATQTATEKLDGTLPMLYGKARFDLPLTGLSVSVIINYISASGNTISDTSTVLGYESEIGFGIEGGIRAFSLELEDEDDFSTDLKFDGVFVNATYHF